MGVGEKFAEYKVDLNKRYWEYKKSQFSHKDNLFNPIHTQEKGPPVFLKNRADKNIIFNPSANQEEINRLLTLVPYSERHRWFGSMNSSQALAQSILGNLAIYNLLDYLSEVKDDDGKELFGNKDIQFNNFSMEHKIDYLGELKPHFTSLDGFIHGGYRVAIECKLIEPGVGSCSRPRLKPKDNNDEKDYCDGSYKIQKPRKTRCSLTERNVSYWDHVPKLFNWQNNLDMDLCPLNKNYQLVRNILAIGVTSDKNVYTNKGLVILIYDKRNPAFQKGGNGFISYMETREALLDPTMLTKCSWQSIVQHLRKKNVLPWLTDELNSKYGL